MSKYVSVGFAGGNSDSGSTYRLESLKEYVVLTF